MRLVVIGDVGVTDDMMHIGDEAMFEALLDELRPRGAADIVALSRAPAETAHRYGVSAVRPIGFRGDRSEMDARFAEVRAFLAGHDALPEHDALRAVVEAVRSADAVAVAGGGNMASTWPMHVYERAALGLIAERYGRPVVVTGQTLGPRLTVADRDLLGALLRGARLVGVRERASERLALELGVERAALRAGLDDASFLGGDDAEVRTPGPATTPFLLVSLSGYLGDQDRGTAVTGIARALDDLAAETGLNVVFHPHFGSLDADVLAGDEVLHADIASAMRAPSTLRGPGTPRSAAGLARGAAMLVTSRYHPSVFATPAGVPVAALTVDDYTAVKLGGATAWWGREHGVIPLADVARASGGAALRAVWARRDAAQAESALLRPDLRRDASSWWDRIAEALGS
ncbi:polysaccharide pyruvyl transferase family protein [Microbacterium sp. P01]|uniref:polysaccharide pyruvyl transferase family protein n=1 Tax=Microbacterium sp. P01 TaxID=3366261 RepID=UPI003671E7F3